MLFSNTHSSDVAQLRADTLTNIGSALRSDGDFLIYGCDAAAGVAGQGLVNVLARLTQADVAASTDATGAPALGGNWVLETQTGQIESRLITEQNMAGFNAVLAAPVDENYDGNVG